jgi:hypothetical protein
MKNSAVLFYLKKIQRFPYSTNVRDEKRVQNNFTRNQIIHFKKILKRKELFSLWKLNSLGKRRKSLKTSNFLRNNLLENQTKIDSFSFKNSKFGFLSKKSLEQKLSKKCQSPFFFNTISCSSPFLKYQSKNTLKKQSLHKKEYRNVLRKIVLLKCKSLKKQSFPFFFVRKKKLERNILSKKTNLFNFLSFSSFPTSFFQKMIKISFAMLNHFLQSQILNRQEMSSIFFLKNTNNCFLPSKYFKNFIFFKFFFPSIFNQNRRKKDDSKRIQIHKFQEKFLEKKTNLAQFFCKEAFDMNIQKTLKKKNQAIEEFENKKYVSNSCFFDFFSLKLKSLLFQFFVEIQFSFFSNLKNFQSIKINQNKFHIYLNKKIFFQAKKNQDKFNFFFQNFSSSFREKKRYVYFLFENFKQLDQKIVSCVQWNAHFSFTQPILFVQQKKRKEVEEKRAAQSTCLLLTQKPLEIQNQIKKCRFSFQKTWCLKFFILWTSSFLKDFADTTKLQKNLKTPTLPYKRNVHLNHIFKNQRKQTSEKYKKNLFLTSFKLYKKLLFLFVEYFFSANYLSSKNDSSQNFQDFELIFSQFLKVPLSSFEVKIKKTKSFLSNEIFSGRMIDSSILYFFLKSTNFSKVDEIHLIQNLQKTLFQNKKNSFSKLLFPVLTENQHGYEALKNKNMALKFSSFCLPKQKKQKQSFLQGLSLTAETFFYSNVFSFDLEKNIFHLFRTFEAKKIRTQVKKKTHFFFSSNLFFFKNFFLINHFRKYSLINPLDLIFQTYHGNFLFYESTLLFFLNFLNVRKFLKMFGPYFEKVTLSKGFLFHNLSFNSFFPLNNDNFFEHIFSISSFNPQTAPMIRNSKNIQSLLKFRNVFWLFSNKLGVSQIQHGRMNSLQISSIFSLFAFLEKRKFFSIKKNYFKNSFFVKMNFPGFNFRGLCLSVSFQHEKNLQRSFSFDTTLTRENIDLHLKECKKILKNSIGQKQLDFMKKLQTKIRGWCHRYKRISKKSVFYYCDSMMLKFLWNWACRTHPNKSKYWIRQKYFHLIHSKNFSHVSKKWFFGKKIGKKFFCLPLHSQTQIQNTFSKQFAEYFYSPTFLRWLKQLEKEDGFQIFLRKHEKSGLETRK